MRLGKGVFAIGAVLLVVALLLGSTTPAIAQPAAEPGEKVPVLIGFTHQPGAAEQALVRGVGGLIKYTYHIVPAIAATVPEAAIAGLSRNPNVTHVEEDGVVRAVELPAKTPPWGMDRIDAEVVHAAGNKGTGVKVAIIDSGIDYNHPDLAANYEGGDDFVNPDNDPMDDYGHGTHVAGTVAAEDNDVGVVGVAPEASLYALKVLDENGYGSWSDVIAAIEWATGLNSGVKVNVINMSLGGGYSSDVGAACQAAYDAGIVVVAAAGNSGNPPGKGDNVEYPAAYASVIAVAATDSSDSRARWSSTGPAVELAAPGVGVLSTWNDGTSTYDPQPDCYGNDGCYKEASGTSMASPHVAGTAALVIASGITNNVQVRSKLQATADDLGATGKDNLYGHGLVDADEAALPPQPVTDIAITAVDAPASVVQGTTVDVSVTVRNVGNQDVTSDITVTLADDTDGVTIGTQTISGGLTAGASTTLTYSWDTAGASLGDHTLTASHNFADNDVSNNSKSTSVTVKEEAAGVTVTSISLNTMKAGETIGVTITGSGFVDGAEVTFENGSGPAPTASSIVVVDASTITATVTAKSGGPPKNRVWDVWVTNPDGSSGVLVGGFTVTP